MNLVIHAHTLKNEPLSQPITGRFDVRGGTIGRSDTNTLALPDPERHISRLQAEVQFLDGRFSIRNVGSSNPIIINGRPLLCGESAVLGNADDIVMGGYEMRVVLSTQPARARGALATPPAVAAPVPRAHPPAPFSPSETLPVPMQLEPAPASPTHLPDDSEPFARPATRPSPVPAQVDVSRSPSAEGDASPQKPSPQQIAAFEELLGDSSSQQVSFSLDAPPATAGKKPPQSLSGGDLSSQALPPPGSAAPPPPRPWYKFGTGTDTPVPAKPRTNAAGAKTPADTTAPPSPTAGNAPALSRRAGILRPPHEMAETTSPAVRVTRESPFTQEPPKPMPPIPGPGGTERPAPAPSPIAIPPLAAAPSTFRPTPPPPLARAMAAATPATPAVPASPDALWTAFCEGLGVSMKSPQGLTPDTMRMIGQVLHNSIEGTLKLVAVRAAAKQELRAQVTTIRSRNNNPLKFSPDVATAIERLLQPPARGYMAGPAAVNEAMDDLLGHAIGTMSGMRAALAGVLQRFEPERLDSQLSEKSMMDSLLPMNRRAKLWELYLQHFERIHGEAEEDFHELFGKAFLAAYNEQLDRLDNDRRTPKT